MNEIQRAHLQEHGVKPEILVSVPGVAALLGEFTEVQNGILIQTALPDRVYVSISRRKDSLLRIWSENYGERKRCSINSLKYKREDRWANLAKGVLFELHQMGYSFRGMDVTVYSEIKEGIGFGVSTAIGLGIAHGANALYHWEAQPLQLVQAAGLAESTYLGKSSELAKGFTMSFAEKGSFLLTDMKSLEYEHIPWNFSAAELLLTDSNVPVIQEDEEDRLEKSQACSDCLNILKEKRSGNSLRDYSADYVRLSLSGLPEYARRYCRHIIEEIHRVEQGREFLLRGDHIRFGKLMGEAHSSLRDNFELSCPELDWLIKRIEESDGVFGSKLTGSGLGGCTLTLMQASALDQYIPKLEEYDRIFGFTPSYRFIRPEAGVRIERV
jgi:galactokinase